MLEAAAKAAMAAQSSYTATRCGWWVQDSGFRGVWLVGAGLRVQGDVAGGCRAQGSGVCGWWVQEYVSLYLER